MITVTDLKKVYYQGKREIRALDGVTLTVPGNSVHGVIGHSGAGKSTLVRCVALLDRPTSGTVEINGVDLTSVEASELRRARRRLGLVFQQANLFDSRTVAHNVAYPLELANVPRAERAERAAELLRLVGLQEAGEAYPAQLSGGQRQRVGIARALATDPEVLLCDEPTSALDPRTTDEILDLIASLRERLGLAVLVITHEMHVVKRICDSVSLLEAGRIVESGSLVEVVGKLQGRLSESLLALPPVELPATGDGTLIDLLAAADPSRGSILAAVAQRVGTDLPVVAGSIEKLGGVTFHRLRVLAPPELPATEAVAAFQAEGAQAVALTGPNPQEAIR